MAQQRVVEEIRGVVQEFRHHEQYGDSFKLEDRWYTYSKDGPSALAPRPQNGDTVQAAYVLWQRTNDQGVTQTRRYLQGVQILGTANDDEPEWDQAEEAMLLEPRSIPAAPPTPPPPPASVSNGRAPAQGAQPVSPPRASAPLPSSPNTLNPTLQLRIEAGKIAATYLAGKDAVDTDEALLRCAELVEAWLVEDRPHFVAED